MKGSTIITGFFMLSLLFSAQAKIVKPFLVKNETCSNRLNGKDVNITAESIQQDVRKFMQESRAFMKKPEQRTLEKERSLKSQLTNFVLTVAQRLRCLSPSLYDFVTCFLVTRIEKTPLVYILKKIYRFFKFIKETLSKISKFVDKYNSVT